MKLSSTDLMPTKYDLTTYPPFCRLTVTSRGPDYVYGNGRHTPQWWCLCSCGQSPPKLVRQGILISGHTRSCGCLRKEELQRMRQKSFHEACSQVRKKASQQSRPYRHGVFTSVV